MAGTIAARSADVDLARRSGRRTSSRSTEACVIESPTRIGPRACSAAMRADRPGPGRRPVEPARARRRRRSSRPAPTPCHGSAIWTMLTPAISAFSGWTHGSCSRAAARISSPTRDRSRASAGSSSKPSASRVGDRVPHAAVRDVDRRASRARRPRAARRAGRRSTARSRARPTRPCRPGSRRAMSTGRRAPRAGASSPARPSRPCPSRAGPSRRRSCSSPTSRGTRSAP